jgi:hypothetical protein
VSPADPVAGRELGEQRLVETARRLRVEILDGGGLPEVGKLEPGDEPPAFALDGLAIDCPALRLHIGGGNEVYSAIVYAIGIAFSIALALFPKTAPAQEVLTGRGIICDTAGDRSFPRNAPDQQLKPGTRFSSS